MEKKIPQNSPAIICHNLSHSYGNKLILDRLCFTINSGEFILLIGPNGGGKSTLLRLLIGLEPIQSGSIGIDGHLPNDKKLSIGYVPQKLQIDSSFPITVKEFIRLGTMQKMRWYHRFTGYHNKLVEEVLGYIGLSDRANSSLRELSGGMMQRVLIARALVAHPKYLVLDEPEANVDQKNQQELYDLLKKWQKKWGTTILIATHHIQSVIQYADRVLTVQQTGTLMPATEVCEHFALGLYHYPLAKVPSEHLAAPAHECPSCQQKID